MKEITNKWPAKLITGEKKVTEEQAIDIIIRTDEAVTKLCLFTVENGNVTYHDEPFKDHFSRDLITESFNKENPFISECYVSNEFLKKIA